MYLCLSSGSTEQYRLDIIRALAMPRGARLQFRYRRVWVQESILATVGSKSFRPDVAIIAYIDQSGSQAVPRIVPCRSATVIDSRPHGSTVSLQLQLAEFCLASDVDRFNSEVRAAVGNRLPTRRDGKLNGLYWLEIPSLSTVSCSGDLSSFEQIVQQLSDAQDFKAEPVFFHVGAIRRVGQSDPIVCRDGEYVLKAPGEYDLGLYHWQGVSRRPCRLDVSEADASLQFRTSPRLEIASSYDFHDVRFRVVAPTPGSDDAFASLSFTRAASTGVDDDAKATAWLFDLSLNLTGGTIRRVLIALLIGLLLAAPQAVAALENEKLSPHQLWGELIVILIANFVASLFAVFAITRPL
jgi:hypothetical protein